MLGFRGERVRGGRRLTGLLDPDVGSPLPGLHERYMGAVGRDLAPLMSGVANNSSRSMSGGSEPVRAGPGQRGRRPAKTPVDNNVSCEIPLIHGQEQCGRFTESTVH